MVDLYLWRASRSSQCRLEWQCASAYLLAKIQAELLAIDGLYTTADDVEAHLRGRPVQAWLDREA